MASTTDIRQWARTQGLEVADKGPLSPSVKVQYEEAHAATADPEYPDGPGAAVATAAPPPAADPRQAERAPAAPKATPAGRGRGVLGRLRGAPGKAKPKGRGGKSLPRVSLTNLIEDAWGQMAFAASPMPPMQRLLQSQAPFAGIALDDALEGTVFDRALQPVARAEDKAKAVGGLMMPPMALMLVLATAPVPQVVTDPSTGEQTAIWPDPSVQHKGALMSFRWSLMLMAEAGGARLEEYQARAEASAERGRQADDYMAWILGYGQAPDDDPGPGPAAAEDEAVRRAQELFGQGVLWPWSATPISTGATRAA
jgi:hypothetical protein